TPRSPAARPGDSGEPGAAQDEAGVHDGGGRGTRGVGAGPRLAAAPPREPRPFMIRRLAAAGLLALTLGGCAAVSSGPGVGGTKERPTPTPTPTTAGRPAVAGVGVGVGLSFVPPTPGPDETAAQPPSVSASSPAAASRRIMNGRGSRGGAAASRGPAPTPLVPR